MSDVKWGWIYDGDELAHGTYESREAAIDAAKDYDPERTTAIHVGHCVPLTAEPYLPDASDLIERLEEQAYDDDFSFWDDELFTFRGDPKQANEELQALLKQWSDKWVKPSRVWYLEELERVKIEATEGPDAPTKGPSSAAVQHLRGYADRSSENRIEGEDR